MSIIGNPIMAGGGGPTASIKVMGLSQSDTVTAAMGSKTKTAKWVTDGSYWLIDGIRDFGTWTVTATNGTKTATQDVLVDVITEYEITMDYRFYLYNEGDECEDVTGGWSVTTGITGYACTNSKIDFTPFARLCIDVTKVFWASTENVLDSICLTITFGDTSSAILNAKIGDITKDQNGVIQIDLPQDGGAKYLEFVGIESNAGWQRIHRKESNHLFIAKNYNTFMYRAESNINRIWLE